MLNEKNNIKSLVRAINVARTNPNSSQNNQEVSLVKNTFSKKEFNQNYDNSFTEITEPEQIRIFDLNLATIEDFFNLYERFFYDIPKEGASNSHRFLIDESSEYANYEATNQTINALLEEISTLRQQNLELSQQIGELFINSPSSSEG